MLFLEVEGEVLREKIHRLLLGVQGGMCLGALGGEVWVVTQVEVEDVQCQLSLLRH